MKNDCINILLYIKDINFDYMRNNYINTFLYMRNMNSEYIKNESEIYLRNFRINNELFIEIENIFSEYYDDIINISCAWIWVCCKDNNERKKIIIKIFSLEIEDEDIKIIEFESKFEYNHLYWNYEYDFS